MGHDARQITNAEEGGTAASPARTCVVTREELGPDELIRFVCDPHGRIVPDVARRLPGRGVWVTCSRETVEAAAKSGAFVRALRRPVTVPDDLGDLVDRLLVRRAVEALGLANKAGLVVTGFAKTEAAITAGQGVALLHASDAAGDGAGKLDRKFRAVWRERTGASDPKIVTVLASAELSLAMGRPNVVHAALTGGGAGTHFLRATGRLQRYRATSALVKSSQPGANTESA